MRTSNAAWATVASLAMWAPSQAHAQPRPDGQQEIPKGRESSKNIDIDDESQVRQLLETRTAAIASCVKSLMTRDQGNSDSVERKGRAIRLLGALRASDSRDAVLALTDNLNFRDSASSDHFDPLDGFAAAKALRDIGASATPVLLAYAKHERSDDELRLVAFVLYGIYDTELGRERIESELKRILMTWPELIERPDTQVINLQRLSTWMKDANFLMDRRNWPSRCK